MAKDFYTAIKERRSIYGISKDVKVSDERIQEIVEFAVNHTPSSFNSQSSRAVVLLGDQHDKFWNITTETLRKIVPADQFASTQEKMNAFGNGYGTVLFFEDQHVIEGLQEQFALYKDNFPIWSEQSSGMLQLVVWTALESEGLGATLQHYNPLVDEDVKKEWNIPEHWKLIAQLPFGHPVSEPGEKDFAPISERVKIHK
ncbi:nitroreductase family protein [Bacillus sonorensis]|uniref:nitroreductase family protein n=1 Tax=Bacillus sonorensis TaxID=119858 RepID=UPI003D1E2B19